MKKLTLALALALGVAHVNAIIPVVAEKNEISAEADINARIQSSDLNEIDKAGVMALVKNHKALTAAVALVIVAGGACAVDSYLCSGAGLDKLKGFLPTEGTTYDWVIDPISNNPVKAKIAAFVTLVAILAVCEREALVKVYKKLTAAANAQEATVIA